MSDKPNVVYRSEWREAAGQPQSDVAKRDAMAQDVIDDPTIRHVSMGTSMVFAQHDPDGIIWVYDCIVVRSCFALSSPPIPWPSTTPETSR